MQYTKRHALRRYFASTLLCAGLMTDHAVQAAATFNAASGELQLPSVMIDWENSFYAVTLKRATLDAPLALGDEFEIKAMIPNATPEDRNSNFLTASTTAYVPEVHIGDKSYRLLLQFMPQKGTLRVSSMEDATLYSALTGEPGISSYFQRLQQQINQAEMPTTCSDASLFGVYSYATGGAKRVNEQWVQFLEIGVNYFDGQGNVLKAYTNSLNSKTETVKGKYGVFANCRGEINYDTGEQFYFFTPPMGDKFYYVQSLVKDTGNPDTGWMERQSKGLDFTCTAATLKGTYAYGGRGFKNNSEYTETGLESFDGKGNVTNIYTDTQTGKDQHSRGTYQITPYCDALVTYDSQESYVMHVSPDGESMPFIQYGGLKDGEIFGGMERRVSLLSYDLAPPATATPSTTTSTTRRTGAFDFNPSTLPNIDLPPLLKEPPPLPPPPPTLIPIPTMENVEKPVGIEDVVKKMDTAYSSHLGANNPPPPTMPHPYDKYDFRKPEDCGAAGGSFLRSSCRITFGTESRSSCMAKGGRSFISWSQKPSDYGGGTCYKDDYGLTKAQCWGTWESGGCKNLPNPYGLKFP